MSLDHARLPEPLDYFEAEGLKLTGRSRWRSATCPFHGGRQTLRVNTDTGGWCCMACGEKGGDVLAFHMAMYGQSFAEAARALGAWVEDSRRTPARGQPIRLSASDRLKLLSEEALVLFVIGSDMHEQHAISEGDFARLGEAVRRLNIVLEG